MWEEIFWRRTEVFVQRKRNQHKVSCLSTSKKCIQSAFRGAIHHYLCHLCHCPCLRIPMTLLQHILVHHWSRRYLWLCAWFHSSLRGENSSCPKMFNRCSHNKAWIMVTENSGGATGLQRIVVSFSMYNFIKCSMFKVPCFHFHALYTYMYKYIYIHFCIQMNTTVKVCACGNV